MVYVIVGGPATGKGVRSAFLAKHFNIANISTGDLMRALSLEDERIRDILAKGELVDDETVTKELELRLSQPDCENGYIIDGYPRNIEQAKLLDELLPKLGRHVDAVIELVVDYDVALKRIINRRECQKCGEKYGVSLPPKVPEVCDKCGNGLWQRDDDTEPVFKKRVEIYNKLSAPILEYYSKQGILKTISAEANPESIIAKVTPVTN